MDMAQSPHGPMNELITALRAFAACYKGDPEGLKSDFELVAGLSIQELTDMLDDEVVQHKT
jgi:hypothetical protein